MTKFNVLINGRNFYDQPISHEITKYNELIKLTTVTGEDFATGCLLDYKYYKEHYKITACDLSKESILDSDPRNVQEIQAEFMLNVNFQILTILEKSREAVLESSKGQTKVL